MVEKTDVAIVGAGPAGLFAVFECGMLGLRCHAFDSLDAPGGQCAALYPAKPIYDIPGIPRIDGAELAERLRAQAAPFAPRYRLGRAVTGLERRGDRWRVTAAGGAAVDAAAVMIAAGAGAFGFNRPPLDGIESYEGKAVFYAVSDPERFRDRRIVIAGGGDSAVDWALALADRAARVTVVHRRARFRAAPDSAARLEALAAEGRIDLAVPYRLAGLEGDGEALEAVALADLDGGRRRVPADALLAFYGLASTLGPIAGWGLALERSRIAVDPATCETDLPGVFAIGDVAAYPGKLKLILAGFSEAALAAHAAFALARPGQALHFEYSTAKGVPAAPPEGQSDAAAMASGSEG